MMSIALLCSMQWPPAYQLDCQQYYIECVDKVEKNIETPLIDEDEKQGIALKVCVKTATIRNEKISN